MIESLRELEKNIETFQQNVVASNELNDLLRGVIGQAKNTEETFNAASLELLSKLDELPGSISEKNLEYAEAVKQESDDSFTRMAGVFNAGQERYTEILQKTEEQIRAAQASAQEELAAARDTVRSEGDRLVETAGKLPDSIAEKNAEYANALKEMMTEELQGMIDAFRIEQDAYLEKLNHAETKLEETEAKLADSEKNLAEKYSEVIGKLNELGNSGIYSLRSELESKMKGQTILTIIMTIIIVLIGGRFFF